MTETDTQTQKVEIKKFGIGGFIAGIVLVVVLFEFIVSTGIRVYGWDGSFIEKVVHYTKSPAVMVDYSFVSYEDYLEDVNALSKFMEIQANTLGEGQTTSRDDIKRIVLNQFINRKLIEGRLRSYGIKITDDEIEKELSTIVKQVGSREQLETELQKLYGFGIDDFKNKIISFGLMQEQLAQQITKDQSITENKEAKQRAEDILDRINNGESFEEVAKTESEDETTAPNGGDLGDLQVGDLVQDFENAALALDEGQVSNIVTTPFGYHIIKLESKTLGENNEVTGLHVRHILIRGVSMDDYMKQIKDSASIVRFVNVDENLI